MIQDTNEINKLAQSFVPQPHFLQGRVILVTGAGDGIGRVAAKTFASYGATVILLGRTLSKLEKVYDEIEALGFPEAAIIPMNLQRLADHDLQQIATVIEEEFGRLDGILHNAAMLGSITPLSMYDIDSWQNVLQINLTAPLAITQTLLPLLKKTGDASVVFTSSSVGRTPRAFWGGYAISKVGLEFVSAIFSQELSNVSSIRFNCINPGATRTNMRADAYPGENPLTVSTPEEIMPAYLFLFSNESKHISGQSLDAQ